MSPDILYIALRNLQKHGKKETERGGKKKKKKRSVFGKNAETAPHFLQRRYATILRTDW